MKKLADSLGGATQVRQALDTLEQRVLMPWHSNQNLRARQLQRRFPPPLPRGYDLAMAVAVSIFGVAFAAFCIWLTVRIVNRRELSARWTLAVVIGLPVLYVASFAPACWLYDHGMVPEKTAIRLYRPLLRPIPYYPVPVVVAIRVWGNIGCHTRNPAGDLMLLAILSAD